MFVSENIVKVFIFVDRFFTYNIIFKSINVRKVDLINSFLTHMRALVRKNPRD